MIQATGLDISRLIADARAGNRAALNALLAAVRPQLQLAPGRTVPPAIRSKHDTSDMIQDSLLEASRCFTQFHGTTEAELLAWLRTILRNNNLDARRQFARDKADVGREVPLNGLPVAGPGETPSEAATAILAEVAHRLMTIEAQIRRGWTSGKVLQRLKSNPGVVQSLTGYRAAAARITQSRIQVLPVDSVLIVTAIDISQQTGLLTNDALMIAQMRAQGLTKLASNDADLDRVPGITRYAPA